MIPPLLTKIPSHKQEFLDHNFIQLLSDQLKEFYEEQIYVHLVSPLILAIRALITKNDQLRKEFSTQDNMDRIMDISVRTF